MISSLLQHRQSFAMTCAFLLFMAPTVLAANSPVWNVRHFSKRPKALYSAASKVAAPDGADVAVLDQEDYFKFDANCQVTHTSYIVYKILTREAAGEWTRVVATWQPWRTERPTFRARVITPDDTVYKLNPVTIFDAPAREGPLRPYSDLRVLYANLPGIEPGAVVERETVLVMRPAIPAGGNAGHHPFGLVGIPVQHRRFVIDAPSSLPVYYALEHLPDLNPQRTETKGRVKLAFEAGPIAPLPTPEASIPTAGSDHLQLLYSVGTTWQQVTDQYSQIVEGLIRPAEVKPLAENLTQGKSSRSEKEQALLDFLNKEIRYTGIDFGETGVIPRPTAETLTRKYGDSKDRALLLVAMLRALDIPAFVAIVYVGRGVGVRQDLPGLGIFNHMIVYLPGDPDQWIDPTGARLRPLPIRDQGQLALIMRPGTVTLARTPGGS